MTPMSDSEALSWDHCVRMLAELPALPLGERAEVVERLVRSSSPEIRDRAMHIGAAVLSERRLIELLREDGDATLRNAGSEIFRLRGGRSLPTVVALLGDPDPDVVLQAVLILDRLRDPRALGPLHAVLSHPDVNVAQEAILAVGRLGDGRSVPRLLPFLNGDPWLQIAAMQALGDLRAGEGVAPLAALLDDPYVASLAAESLARIGGADVLALLGERWRDAPPAAAGAIDDETMAGLLAHVLEGLPAAAAAPAAALRERLARLLGAEGERARDAAARALLCLGPGAWDDEALAVLARSQPVSDFAPEALRRRPDLIPRLLRVEATRSWGFLLAARFSGHVPEEDLLAAARAVVAEPGRLPAEMIAALGQVHLPGVARFLLELYLELPAESRPMLEPALSAHSAALRDLIAARRDLDPALWLELAALLGEPAGALAARLAALDPAGRCQAIGRLAQHAELMRRLPWEEWIREEPDLFGDAAAEVAARHGLSELIPALRGRLLAAPSPALVRALGQLRDGASLPALLGLAAERRDLLPVVLEALGQLGGDAARDVLRTAAQAGGPEARIAYRALAAGHQPEDLPLFRAAVAHADWFVRLAAARVLALSTAPGDAALLARLVADPVPAVAQKALALLELGGEEIR
jgi:HEAT repeat protein